MDRTSIHQPYTDIDWLITVPLLMVEFYIIQELSKCFWRYLLETYDRHTSNAIGGYMGEAGYINEWAGFIVGMAGWAYIFMRYLLKLKKWL